MDEFTNHFKQSTTDYLATASDEQLIKDLKKAGMDTDNLNIENPYLTEFNKNFRYDFHLKKSEDLEAVDGINPIDIILGSGDTIYSIIPFEFEEKSTLEYESTFSPNKTIKYQLIGYKYHPARGMNPPETEDKVIVPELDSFDSALIWALKLILEEDFNDLITFVSESVRDEKQLPDEQY